MKRIGLYGSIVVVALAGLTTVLLTPSASPPPATMTPSTIEEAMATWFPPTNTPQPANTPAPPTPVFYDEYTIVILGQDETVERCWKGERCGEASHSDVFVIVHVVMADPPYAVAILVPRNLYVPPEMMLHGIGAEWDQPIWSMQVYGKLGYDGIHRFVDATFGLPVQAVFVTKMDRFVKIVDALGGLTVEGKTLTGTETLAYLRDNTNNWGCPTYDCNGRIFKVAEALRNQAAHDNVFGLLDGKLLEELNGLYETDLGVDQILWLLVKYAYFEMAGGRVGFVRLWTPEVERADTPLGTRGMVPTTPLHLWMGNLLFKESLP